MMGRQIDPQLIDIDRLTAPISAERPCGQWLRYDVLYDQVRDSRREDDAGLPQGVWETELKRANWVAVEALCSEAIALRSKDLQLAAWLMEAWIQLDGFSGAARGIELMHLLCERFWEEMYPALDNDLEPRLAPIKWVNDKLSRRIRLVRLTQPSMEGMAAYSLAEWDVAMRNPGGATSGETVTVGKFEQSVKLTAYAWFVGLQRDVKETLDRLAALDDLIDEKAGKLAPGLIKFRNEVAAAARLVEAMLSATRGPEPEAPTPAQIAIAGDEGIGGQSMLPSPQPPMMPELIPDAASAAGVPGMRIRSRAEAYSLLEEIAEFLRRNDPHSPTPYLISRAVAWGGMHFDELLPELVRDRGELSEILKLLNLDPPSSKL